MLLIIIFMLLVIFGIGGIICGVQLIPLIGSILPTEIALKEFLIRMEQDDKFKFMKLIFFKRRYVLSMYNFFIPFVIIGVFL